MNRKDTGEQLQKKVAAAEIAWTALMQNNRLGTVMGQFAELPEKMEARETWHKAVEKTTAWANADVGTQEEIDARDAMVEFLGSAEMASALGEETAKKTLREVTGYLSAYDEAERTRILAVKECGDDWRPFAISHLRDVRAWLDALENVQSIFDETGDNDPMWQETCAIAVVARENAFGQGRHQLEWWGEQIQRIPNLRRLVKEMTSVYKQLHGTVEDGRAESEVPTVPEVTPA